jgi:hypothetical protein
MLSIVKDETMTVSLVDQYFEQVSHIESSGTHDDYSEEDYGVHYDYSDHM